ncbi:MAG: hypothetical protein GC165_05925 [Armatimonadetes bacterium]|nr:hypothetical protein [Armatimonadota bacterium]MBS1725108.1 hypothetical protein [Armatimonadota bacterium]
MTDKDIFKRGFEYDLWANKQWLDCLDRTGAGEPDRSLLQHILGSQLIWAMRLAGESPTAIPKPDLTVETMETINAKWLGLLETIDLQSSIEFRRTTGEGARAVISWIVQHAINHGTYHRGELRGLRRARGDEDFPETDFIGYGFSAGGAERI